MTMFFFGERWDAPAFDDAVQVATPVGEPCGYCEVKIKADDQGTQQVFGYANGSAAVRSVHLGCYLRAILGSPAHLLGRCSCHGGTDEESGMSAYEEGLETLRILRERMARP